MLHIQLGPLQEVPGAKEKREKVIDRVAEAILVTGLVLLLALYIDLVSKALATVMDIKAAFALVS